MPGRQSARQHSRLSASLARWTGLTLAVLAVVASVASVGFFLSRTARGQHRDNRCPAATTITKHGSQIVIFARHIRAKPASLARPPSLPQESQQALPSTAVLAR